VPSGLRRAVCTALGLPPASFYRRRRPAGPPKAPRRQARALSAAERAHVLATLHEERFIDLAPAEVYATLLDEGTYLCSIRTMYRILAANFEVRERRNQLTHPAYTKPELLATGPNQVWSWDITKLKGPAKWSSFQLYVIIDIFSRCVVGWMLADRESATLAKMLIAQTCRRHGITPGTLTLHADRGSAMTAKATGHLLADLGITKTHSRPYQSNDNPYSESQFKTMKYRPEFPDRFGSIQDARAFCRTFFDWYNNRHHHSGIGLLTPQQVHSGHAGQIRQQRQDVLNAAHARHPNRFVRTAPQAPAMPTAAWINPPENSQAQAA
jgi:transposase InsO family protein